jgi:hypothetical protein
MASQKVHAMIPLSANRLSAVPGTLQTRIEIAKAIRALAAQGEQEQRQTIMDVAHLDPDQLGKSLHQACRGWADLAYASFRKFDPDQPRVAAGKPNGGQWTSEGGSGPMSDSTSRVGTKTDVASRPNPQYASLDTGTRTDATESASSNPQTRGESREADLAGGNDNLTPQEACRQAYADAVALARINPLLGVADYLKVRQESAVSLDDCLNLAHGDLPISRYGDFVFFHGGGVVIFKPGRPPIYVPPAKRR